MDCGAFSSSGATCKIQDCHIFLLVVILTSLFTDILYLILSHAHSGLIFNNIHKQRALPAAVAYGLSGLLCLKGIKHDENSFCYLANFEGLKGRKQ
jgi:hypothetical protein